MKVDIFNTEIEIIDGGRRILGPDHIVTAVRDALDLVTSTPDQGDPIAGKLFNYFGQDNVVITKQDPEDPKEKETVY